MDEDVGEGETLMRFHYMFLPEPVTQEDQSHMPPAHQTWGEAEDQETAAEGAAVPLRKYAVKAWDDNNNKVQDWKQTKQQQPKTN